MIAKKQTEKSLHNDFKDFFHNQSGIKFVLSEKSKQVDKRSIIPYINMNIGRKNWLAAININISFNPQTNPFASRCYQFTYHHIEQEKQEEIYQQEKQKLLDLQKQKEKQKEEELKQLKIQQEKAVFLAEMETNEEFSQYQNFNDNRNCKPTHPSNNDFVDDNSSSEEEEDE